jgi:hypothetical protein
VYHSSVSASHGSFPARTPLREMLVRQTLTTKNATPSAVIPEPMDDMRLYASQSPPWWYV